MVQVQLSPGNAVSWPTWLKADADFIVNRLTRKQPALDAVVIFFGMEGTAKTTISSQFAEYVSSRIGTTYTLEDNLFFGKSIYTPMMEENGKRYKTGSVLDWDEPDESILSGAGLSKWGMRWKRAFASCRSKRRLIIIKWPRLEMLPKWLVDRSSLVYETYFTRVQRADGVWQDNVGFIKGYNAGSTHLYYLLMRKHNLQGARKIRTTLPSTFGYWMPWPEKEYDQYKQKMLSQSTHEDMKGEVFDKKELIYRLFYETKATGKELARIFGYHTNTVQSMALAYKEAKADQPREGLL